MKNYWQDVYGHKFERKKLLYLIEYDVVQEQQLNIFMSLIIHEY
jgi:hypothetical protein